MNEEPRQGAPQFKPLGTLEFEPTACPVCGAREVSRRLEKHYRGLELGFGYCADCATLYANPRLTVESLRRLYSSQEFFEGRQDNLNYYSFLSGERYLRRTARGRIERFREHTSGRRLLEAASAAGFFLAEAKDAGFEAEGVEFSVPMAEYASDRWGVPVTAASIEEVELEADAYDVIASWGLMTILRDPRAVMSKFHTALKPGGVWAFNTYDNQSLWGRLFGSHWYILVPKYQPDPQRPHFAPAHRRRGLRPRGSSPGPSLRQHPAAPVRVAVPRKHGARQVLRTRAVPEPLDHPREGARCVRVRLRETVTVESIDGAAAGALPLRSSKPG